MNTETIQRYTHICISAPTWDDLPDAINDMGLQVKTGNLPKLPSKEELANVPDKNWLEIFIGKTFPQNCVLRVPM